MRIAPPAVNHRSVAASLTYTRFRRKQIIGVFDYRIRSWFTMNLNPKRIRHAHWSKVIRYARWIWTQIHCESWPGSDNWILPRPI